MKLPPAWSATWQQLAPREKLMVSAATALVALALLWWIAIAPALATLRGADAQHRQLDTQLSRMLALQQQARALQSQPRQSYDDSLRGLETAVRERLGTTARLAVAGERATITLTGTSPDALAGFLAQARVNARALPAEARLTRSAAGAWDGTLVLTLPPQR